MSVIAFISVNMLIYLGWHICLSVVRKLSVSESIVYAGLLMAVQIVMTELLLGIAGVLKLPVLITVNLAISGGLLAWLVLARRTLVVENYFTMRRQIAAGFRGVLTPINIILMALGIFLTIWFCVAAYFLPPRGIDDLVSHLPPIYQYIQSHEISLLPLELRDSFAMPLNGEFLFLWPLIFFHADTYIDLAQYFVALYGVVVVFALARKFEVERNDAVFVSLLFLFTPLVLGQAGSNYVDLIVAVCYLTLLYAVVSFWHTGAVFHLILAGIATGFGLGVKYNILIAIVAVQPIILARLWRDGHLRRVIQGYAGYLVLTLPLCVYWFVRNFIKKGAAFYPYQLDFSGMHLVPWSTFANYPGKIKAAPPASALMDFLHDPIGFFFSYMFQDPGLGSFNGGLGVVFWGLGFPAIGYCLYKAVQAALRRDFFPALFWGHVPLTFFIFFLQISSQRLQFNQRLIIVVVGLGLLAIGIVLKKLRTEFPQSVPVIRSSCVAASMLAVVHLAGYSWPSFQLTQPVADLINDERTSEYKYFSPAAWDLPLLRAAWEPLDFLTRSGNGWTVYAAAPWTLSWTTPLFGSRVQNKIWNFQDEPEGYPDAFVFHRMNELELFYVGKKITPEQVWSDGRFEIVTQTSTTQFWANRSLLLDPETRENLVTYYARAFAPEIDALSSVADRLSDGGVLITASPWGHGLKYLSLIDELPIPVHIVPEGKVAAEARRLKAKIIITIDKPLKKYESKSIARLNTTSGVAVFYENRVR